MVSKEPLVENSSQKKDSNEPFVFAIPPSTIYF
jgi:hypothetical protein